MERNNSFQQAQVNELRRELGVFSASLLVVGGIIGSGIFFTPAETARALPTAGWVLGVWTLGGVVALAGALTYAELGAMMPEAGGGYVYVREAFGRLPAFLLGWMTLLMIASGAIAAVAMGFAGYLERFVPIGAVGGRIGVAAITIIALTITNYLGVKPGTVTANIFTLSKIAALGGVDRHRPRAASGHAAGGRGPGRAPARARRGGRVRRGALHDRRMAADQHGGRRDSRSGAHAPPGARDRNRDRDRRVSRREHRVFEDARPRRARGQHRGGRRHRRRLIGPAGATAITVAAMLSIFGFVNVALLTNARVLYALGQDGAFLPSAGKVHPRFGSPHIALLMLGGWSLVLLFATGGTIGTLLSGVVFADWIFFGLGAASVFVLRRTRPDLHRPYRVLGYPWLPAFFVLSAGGRDRQRVRLGAEDVVGSWLPAIPLECSPAAGVLRLPLLTWRSTAIATKSSAR